VDGIVDSGESDVDESLVTGEPRLIEKRPGDQTISGSLNGHGTLLVRVTVVGEESFLRQVIRSVEDARALKPGLLHLVDRVLRVYTPLVLLTAAGATIFWLVVPMIGGGSPDLQRAMFAGLSVLVMGYPCAVGISAPLSIVRGAGEAAERGVLMRTGEAFQALRRVQRVVFDKTGIPAAATGLVYPIWGMVAMAASVTSIFINSLWSRGTYFFQAIKTVGQAPPIPSEAQS
jgi:Cu+-exporting ATPase